MRAKIFINGTDVTRDLSPYLKSVTYEDVSDGETDTAEIELQDVQRLFIADWFPTRGDTLEIELIRENWSGDGQESLPLGTFEVDEISYSCPPSVMKIKANSVSQNSKLRQTDVSKAWENCKLSQIAKDVADEAGVELFYDTQDDPTVSRAELAETSLLAFLEKLCKDHGLCVKVADGKLIVFDEEKLEQQTPVATLDYGTSTIKNFSATATLTEIYKSAEVTYKDGKKDEIYRAKFDAPDKSDGKVLRINQRVTSQAEADKLAKHKLRDKNKKENQLNLTVIGRFDFLSGNVIELKGHGFFNGNWLIERARHTINSSGYEVSLECRKCLNGW